MTNQKIIISPSILSADFADLKTDIKKVEPYVDWIQKKVIVGKESVRQAGLVISYMAMGRMMTKTEIEEVRRIVRNARNNEKAELPPTYTLEEEA